MLNWTSSSAPSSAILLSEPAWIMLILSLEESLETFLLRSAAAMMASLSLTMPMSCRGRGAVPLRRPRPMAIKLEAELPTRDRKERMGIKGPARLPNLFCAIIWARKARSRIWYSTSLCSSSIRFGLYFCLICKIQKQSHIHLQREMTEKWWQIMKKSLEQVWTLEWNGTVTIITTNLSQITPQDLSNIRF